MHSTSLLGSLAALAAVLLLIVVLGRLAARFRLPMLARTRGGDQARLSVRASLAIDPKRRLMIVACDGRESLVLLGPHGDVLIGGIDGMTGPAR